MGCDIKAFREAKYKGGKNQRTVWTSFGSVPIGRNYDLYAFLADVRNRYGIKPMNFKEAEPSDLSLESKWHAEDFYNDYHTLVFVTLDDLLKADWDQVVDKTGYVSAQEYKKMLAEKRTIPDGYATLTTAKIIKPEDIFKVDTTNEFEYYVEYSWQTTMREIGEYFYENIIPDLEGLSKCKDVEEVRLVMFFDG